MSKVATLNYQFTFNPEDTWQTTADFNSWLLDALEKSSLTAEKISGVENGLAISPKDKTQELQNQPKKEVKEEDDLSTSTAKLLKERNPSSRIEILIQ